MNHLKRIAEKQKSNICFHNSFYYSRDPQKDSGRFRKIQEDSGRFRKIQEDSGFILFLDSGVLLHRSKK
jgi:hypothetical protein